MPKFRFEGSDPHDLFPGADSMTVEKGSVVVAPGDLRTDGDNLPDDAYIVVRDGEERAWPHALWSLVEDKPAKAAPVKEN